MPYAVPTLTALLDQGRQDVSNSPLGVDGVLRFSIAGVLSDVMAGFAWQHYDYQAYIAQQSTPWGATEENAAGWGALKGVYRKDATAAVLSAALAGGTPGATVPAGTGFRLLDGTTYASTADATVAQDGTATVTIQAAVPGVAGNADPGARLTLTGSITGVPASGFTVTGTQAIGADQETEDAFRTRYLLAYRRPPQGGALADYLEWTLAIPGVTRAWVTPNGFGAGTVVVYTMLDLAEGAHGGFPQGTNGVSSAEPRDPVNRASGDQQAIADALYPLRPVTALVYSCAPVNLAVPFVIAGLGSANTLAIQGAIVAALQDMFIRVGAVGGSLDPDTMQPWPPIDPSNWFAAIASAVGSNQFTVLAPVAPITPGPGQLPTLDVANSSFTS